ncbi:MAG: hypothetical protein A2Y76_02370 [Planctomycetes bacterium RBG_13_60_9]|nr:MAG: hypothetical protein A2Y76_02370 [Planctomycetes bacterium RBG_13_60_9]
MAHRKQRGIPSAGWILDRLMMGGKKTVVACALIVIMALMWVRVLIGHGPASAGAAPETKRTASAPHRGSAQPNLVELPRSPGRHDSIHQDFFNIRNRAYFRQNAVVQNTSADKEVPVASSDRVREVIHRVAQTLKLESVLDWNESPRAFVNDQLLAVGDKLVVKDGANTFEFEVLQIDVDSVLVKCSDTQLTLKLAQYLEVKK